MTGDAATSKAVTWDAARYDEAFSFVTDYGAPLLELLAAAPGDRVLDLGCGTGHQTAELTAAGIDALGLDADPSMIDAARAAHPRTPYLLADAQQLGQIEGLAGPFDAVVSNAALHWMPDQEGVFRGVRTLLAPEGRFVAEQGGAGNIARVWEAVTNACRDLGLETPDRPWTFPTPGEQAARLEAAGFRVRLVTLTDRPTPLSQGSTVASWVRMFGGSILAELEASTRETLLARVDLHAAEAGLNAADGSWADYVRLRFVAEAV